MYTCILTNFDQQNPTTASLVRPYSNIPVIRSPQKHLYEPSGLGCHPNTMPLHIRESYEISCEHMKHTTIHRQDHLVGLLHVSGQLHLDTSAEGRGQRTASLVVLERTITVH
jgi:hypothetical protein